MFRRIWGDVERVVRAFHARWGEQAAFVVRWCVPAALLVYLAYSLTRLGWAKVLDATPANVSFYAVVLLQFYIQPVADLCIYRYLLRAGAALPLSVMLRKRYANAMLDYSGEVYFFFWARKHLTSKHGMLMHAVKDTNVLSAAAGLVMVWLTLLAVLATGSAALPRIMDRGMWVFLGLGSIPLALGLALFLGGKRVTMLRRRAILVTFGIHLGRCIVKLSLEFLMWWFSGVLASPAVCLQYVALRVLVTRLPLVPNKDIVFVGVGIATAGLLEASASGVAAVLVISTALGLIQNLFFVGLPWLLADGARRAPDRARGFVSGRVRRSAS